ncbi:hypothetical protein [Rufibacter aurantiacus]|uniref:hypothetical protein n=1 Tax=Rufibacter aurantiacus TaxID=2817374 RepID=UPI001B30D7FA|nr:hypothetical protein [Rufibacter aurantiacus]
MKQLTISLFLFLLSTTSLLANPFIKGYYFTLDGKKVEGHINFRRSAYNLFRNSPSDIKFKENLDSKAVKLTPNDISSFVIGTDSFTIAHNIKINNLYAGIFPKDFVQVLISGRMNLAMHRSSSHDGRYAYEHNNYVIYKSDETCLTIWRIKNQKEDIAKFFVDFPTLQSKIMEKGFTYDNLPALVQEYNELSSMRE